MTEQKLNNLKQAKFCLYQDSSNYASLCFIHINEGSMMLEEGVLDSGHFKEIDLSKVEYVDGRYYIDGEDDYGPYITLLNISNYVLGSTL